LIFLKNDSNLTAVVWVHEFNNVGLSVCFEPGHRIWRKRQDAYRQALEEIPEIDGVVLMFGSSSLEPWLFSLIFFEFILFYFKISNFLDGFFNVGMLLVCALTVWIMILYLFI